MKISFTDFNININIKTISQKVGQDIPLPYYATEGSAGLDLCACIDRPYFLQPYSRIVVPTGIAIDIPDKNIVGLIFPRSGLASKYGISLANCAGVIDSDYKGEIKCPIENKSNKIFIIKPGDRIAQLVLTPIYKATLSIIEDISSSDRGSGGFGHTGR
jgi:dUTP pyrophosphatase